MNNLNYNLTIKSVSFYNLKFQFLHKCCYCYLCTLSHSFLSIFNFHWPYFSQAFIISHLEYNQLMPLHSFAITTKLPFILLFNDILFLISTQFSVLKKRKIEEEKKRQIQEEEKRLDIEVCYLLSPYGLLVIFSILSKDIT